MRIKTVVSKELGSAYRLEDGVLRFAPLSEDGTYEDEFFATDEALIGDERVVYDGRDMTFSEAYRLIEKELSHLQEHFPVISLSRSDIAMYWHGSQNITDSLMYQLAALMTDVIMDDGGFWVFIDQLSEVYFFDKLGLTRRADRQGDEWEARNE